MLILLKHLSAILPQSHQTQLPAPRLSRPHLWHQICDRHFFSFTLERMPARALVRACAMGFCTMSAVHHLKKSIGGNLSKKLFRKMKAMEIKKQNWLSKNGERYVRKYSSKSVFRFQLQKASVWNLHANRKSQDTRAPFKSPRLDIAANYGSGRLTLWMHARAMRVRGHLWAWKCVMTSVIQDCRLRHHWPGWMKSRI